MISITHFYFKFLRLSIKIYYSIFKKFGFSALTCEQDEQHSVDVLPREAAELGEALLQERVDTGPGEVHGAVELKRVRQPDGHGQHDLSRLRQPVFKSC